MDKTGVHKLGNRAQIVDTGPMERIVKLGSQFIKDGWKNVLTGLGGPKDKTTGGHVNWRPLDRVFAERLYAADAKAQKIVEKIPKKGTKQWIQFKSLSGDKELAEDHRKEFKRLKVKQKFLQAWTWARLYGGAGVVIITNDGGDMAEPLESFNEIRNLVVLNRWELSPQEVDLDVESDNFMKPLRYFMQPTVSGANLFVELHYTRLIRFEGMPLPRDLFEMNDRWDDSVLNNLEDALRNSGLAHNSLAVIAQDFRMGVITMQGLADIISSDKIDDFKGRIEALNLAKSVLNMLVIDEGEKFEQVTTSLEGLKDLVNTIDGRLVADSNLPHTELLGEGSTGSLSGAGESEEKSFIDTVSDEQDRVLVPPLDRMLELVQLQRSGPTNGNKDDDITYMLNPLRQKDDKEKAEIRKLMAEADVPYIDRGVLTPNEVGVSRFGGDEFSVETQLNMEDRDAQMGLPEEVEPDEFDPEENEDQSDNHRHSVPGTGDLFTGDIVGVGMEHHHILPDGTKTGPPSSEDTDHTHPTNEGGNTGGTAELENPSSESEVESAVRKFERTQGEEGTKRDAVHLRRRRKKKRKKRKKRKDAELRVALVQDAKTKLLRATHLIDVDEDVVKEAGILQSITVEKKVAPTLREAAKIAMRFSTTLGEVDATGTSFRFNIIPLEDFIEGSVRRLKPPVNGVRLWMGVLK